ncbi:SRPBCC family protein [Streptomyces sp. AV19]|uniref:SRPBCC family protein n=1 Tax=Streptomyces sp. AV19 TaxID=2793068 RepID=UPI0018FE629D|nr:SRPBCC family protein [Streptomyces sp. AV19]MBH1936815.1 SRPBCC family protein [Streptomyces sp. AV19]MDG4532856.1 SRPBCC family protein [Streptomyces sp. AV19]
MAGRYRYRFHEHWDLDAAPDAVYAVLEAVDDYPSWWPRLSFTRIDPHSGTVGVRSLLPYELRLTVRERRRDPRARVLEAALDGDLAGRIRWTVQPRGAGTRARFEQDVELRNPRMRRWGPVARPVFLASHGWVMRRGRRGLRRRLERPRAGI